VTRTGLSQDLLRAWERRYGVVTPTRSPGGQRLYTDADIHRIRLLHRATQAGRSISSVARLDAAALEALVRSDEADPERSPATPLTDQESQAVDQLLEAALSAVRALDAGGLDRVLSRSTLRLSVPVISDRILVPLMWRIGDEWEHGTLTPVHEHLASVVVRRFLTELMARLEPDHQAPAIVVATPTGQQIEIGALLVAVSAAAEGWRVKYFGTDLPAAEIAAAANGTAARAVAISLGHDTQDPRLVPELESLAKAIAGRATLLIGGRAARSHHLLIRRLGAVTHPDLAGLRQWLRTARAAA
jgi:DNA-binding transcriptional MerR regulator/methylmalonyl-CoA mutase cobalamin-binding subunit